MRYYGKFKSAGVRSICPGGWHKKFLETQRNGLTGNIEKAGFPFNVLGWDRFKTKSRVRKKKNTSGLPMSKRLMRLTDRLSAQFYCAIKLGWQSFRRRLKRLSLQSTETVILVLSS